MPEAPRPVGGLLTTRQNRIRIGRRALAALGYQEAITWSFIARPIATLFGGGAEALVLQNPIASDLDCMRPSILPGLIEAVGRNARRGFPDCALFEIGPVFAGDEPGDQSTAITAVLAPHGARRWDGGRDDDLFTLKADLLICWMIWAHPRPRFRSCRKTRPPGGARAAMPACSWAPRPLWPHLASYTPRC